MNRLSSERVEEFLERIARLHVLVVGDVMLDVYVTGSASRLSPEAPVPVVRVDREWRSLGGAANVAHNVVALGARCSLVGCHGDDGAAVELHAELRRSGIEAEAGLQRLPGRATSVKTRILVRNQQVARFDRERDEEITAESAAALVERIESLAASADAIVLEDYDKGVLVPLVIEATLDVARGRGVPVVVDPKSRHFFEYRGATVFKPNRAELEAALRAPALADDPAWMERTRRHIDCGNLLITLGSDGMALITEAGEYVRVPTVARSVYDVSGAGDTVTAVLALGLAAGLPITESALLANHAAGVEVGKAGVATVSPEELRGALVDPAG